MPVNGRSKRWVEPDPVNVPPDLQDLVGGLPVLAETLVRRGYSSSTKARAFMDPRCYKPSPASDLPDIERAADRIERALKSHERIGVWGDFDVDGQTSTALLVDLLHRLGTEAAFHIPVRATESHGVGVEALSRFLDDGISLLITCDTGIDATEAVHYAASRGVDVIITDHHELPNELPPAVALVNPKRIEGPHPLRALPGVGVAFQLARELLGRVGRISESRDLLDLVALGVVADLAEQVDDTRFLLQVGLRVLRRTERVGLQVMMELAEVNPDTLSEEQISFTLGPRLNAIGRLGDANPVVNLMLTDSHEEARQLARELERLNARRRLLTDQVFDAACGQIEVNPGLLDNPGLILHHPDWPAGVIGIVASRLVERFHRPTLILTTTAGEIAHGSARSVAGCNITAAISDCSSLLDSYGGHPMAAGVSLQLSQLEPFTRTLQASLGVQIGEVPLAPRLFIDAVLDLGKTDLALVDSISQLGPFGPGNPALTFVSLGIEIKGIKTMGRGNEHRRVTVVDRGGSTRSVVWWKSGHEPPPEGPFDLAYRISAHEYRGKRSLQMEWIDARPAAAPTIINGSKEKPVVIDHRADIDQTFSLENLSGEIDHSMIIWGENCSEDNFLGRDRIDETETLVVWTAPPGRDELQQVLGRSKPRTLYLFSVEPRTATTDQFILFLESLCKHSLSYQDGRVMIGQIAVASAHREATVRAGLELLAARGKFTITYKSLDSVVMSEAGGDADSASEELWEESVRDLVGETAAYRRFYTIASVDELIRTL